MAQSTRYLKPLFFMRRTYSSNAIPLRSNTSLPVNPDRGVRVVITLRPFSFGMPMLQFGQMVGGSDGISVLQAGQRGEIFICGTRLSLLRYEHQIVRASPVETVSQVLMDLKLTLGSRFKDFLKLPASDLESILEDTGLFSMQSDLFAI